MKTLDFFYDFSCPYAYLASTRIERLAALSGARLAFKPFLLGGVFRALAVPENAASAMAPARARMNLLDMARWADHWGVPLVMPTGHPNRTVTALRAAIAAGDDLPRASHALFRAYWAEGRDLSDPAVVAAALDGAGLQGAALVRRADEPAIKDELRARTDEALARGVFGAPAMVVDEQLYWGQDRLHLVARALGGDGLAALEPASRPPDAPPARSFELWFDYSSPFSYLAATQVEALAARTGAEVVYRPFLLGGLFRAIGTADVPISTFSEPKRRHAMLDLQRHAQLYDVPFRFPSRFPMNTIAPLRLTLAAGRDAAKLIPAIFRAYWAEDRDIASVDELARICDEQGVPRALLERTQDPAIKESLKGATSEAAAKGLFGAPSFVVDGEVFWGQDRIDFVERAVRGWRATAR